MHGNQVDIKDIVLQDVNDLILPVNLLCNEDLSQEAELEPAFSPYKIVVYCFSCGVKLKFYIAASREGIRDFEQLLLGQLGFICTGCSRSRTVQDGR